MGVYAYSNSYLWHKDVYMCLWFDKLFDKGDLIQIITFRQGDFYINIAFQYAFQKHFK